ncbi:T9SS type A sorting domain-containing protein [uncultured Tenacibaculum sp.]|uniref:T9SS type A sorting domain-containing protein n=1 Tax=uncultured Tenacibaculum sp. TaxID=174713 RepID=UPI00260D4FFF|nr:T9SS type A sorting domain-containing protein [uncultured Tenacibaculum sp.]
MNKIVYTLLFFLIFNHNFYATNYYVSHNGNDNNHGTIDSPFKTIQKAADIMSSGDICYIREGIYREEVIVSTNNLTFKNYQDEKVIISGADLITNWLPSDIGSNIFEASFTGAETQFSMLFVNNKRQKMARWPNNETDEMMMPEDVKTGYEDCQVFNTRSGKNGRRVKFPNLSGFPVDHFKGGIFRGIVGKKWINPMGIIESSNDTELTVTAISDDWGTNSSKMFTDNGRGFGFIFHLNALDQPGEWFEENGKIYFMPPVGKDPNDMVISAKNRKLAFVLNNRTNIKVDGINIHAASIAMKNANNCEITNGSVQYLWPFFTRKGYAVSKTEQGGIFIDGNENLFKNMYIAHSWGHGIFIDGGRKNKIENCFIDNIGWIAQFTSSIQNFGDGTIVTKSTLGSSGRFHIRTNNKIDITYNDLYDCMKMGQDAGSIQSTNGGNWGVPLDLKGAEIAYNRIHDCNTLTDGNKEFVLALYLEGCFNYTVHHNLIYNFKTDVVPDGTFVYLGPRMATIKDCYYYNNTVWNVDWGLRVWNRENRGDVENILFWNNIIDGKANDGETSDNDRNVNSLLAKLSFKTNIRNITGNGNALFVDANQGDFRLQTNSVAIDGGTEVSGITDGFSGNAPDVGAIEYGSSFPDVGSNIDPEDISFELISDSSTLSTNSSDLKKESIVVYPNPSNSLIKITNLSNNYIEKISWKLTNLNGRELFTGKALTIDISSLPVGVYFLTVNKTKTFKVIKN